MSERLSCSEQEERRLSAVVARLQDELDALRGGPPGPYVNCTDCGQGMVWSPRCTSENSPAWICPGCVYRRMRKAEAALADLKAKLDAFDEEDRNVVELAFEVSEVRAARDKAEAALADARRVLEEAWNTVPADFHGVQAARHAAVLNSIPALLSAPAPQAEADLRAMADKLAELSIAGRFALIDEPSAAVERWRTR